MPITANILKTSRHRYTIRKILHYVRVSPCEQWLPAWRLQTQKSHAEPEESQLSGVVFVHIKQVRKAFSLLTLLLARQHNGPGSGLFENGTNNFLEK